MFAPAAQAAPPANDDLANAQTLSGSSWSDFGTDIGAGAQIGEDTHAGLAASQSVWERWTAPANTKVTVDTCHPSNYDTILEVYSGPAVSPTFATLTSIDDDDDSCGNGHSKVSFSASAGATYYIVIDENSINPDLGSTFSVSLNTAPVNDNFSGTVLTGSPVSVTGSNAHATEEPNEPDHGGQPGGASVWYSWTAPASDDYLIQTCGGTNFNTVLGVYEPGAGGIFAGGITLAGEDDNGCGTPSGPSKVVLPLVGGTTYFIAVDGGPALTSADEGTFRLDIAPGPPNDDLANAIPLTSFPLSPATVLSAASNLAAATKEVGELNHAGNAGGQSVWYRWTAPVSGHVTVDTCGGSTGTDTLLGVYSDAATYVPPLTEVASNDNACGNLSRVAFTATQGTAYLIAVDSVGPGGPVALAIHDVTAPNTAIGRIKVNSSRHTATVSFSGTDDRSDGMTFKCKLDKKAYGACTSPKVYKRLKTGKHKVRVQAIDAAGNSDASPATKSFTV
jgi:hypothetical protein